MNIEAITNGILIKDFYRFKDEVFLLRNDVEKTLERNPEDSFNKLLKILDEHALKLDRLKNEVGDEEIREFFYLLVSFADEIFIDIEWGKGMVWENNLLEERIFRSHHAGDFVFQNIDNLLLKNVRRTQGIGIIYLLALSLGFKGRYLFQDTVNALNDYRKKLFGYIFNTSPNVFDKLKYLFPENYQPVIPAKRLLAPDLTRWIILAAVISLVLIFVIATIIEPNFYKNILFFFINFFRDYKIELIIIFAVLLLVALGYLVYKWVRKYRLLTSADNKYLKFKIKESIKQIIKYLDRKFSSSYEKYELPWYMVLGTKKSGKTSLVNESTFREVNDFALPSNLYDKSVCNFRILESAVILDTNITADKPEDENNIKEYIFHSIKRLHKRRPLDGLVITISCDELIQTKDNKEFPSGPAGLEIIKLKAEYVREQFDLLLKQTRMTLPVYIVITKCDKIGGFVEFVNEIPSKFVQNIFGWSNSSGFQIYNSGDFITEAFGTINTQLSFLQLGIFAAKLKDTNNNKIYLFGRKIDSLKYPLQLFINTLLKNSRFAGLYPPHLRGIYLCGKGMRDEEDTSFNHVFVRDLFEDKIFKESHYAKPVW